MVKLIVGVKCTKFQFNFSFRLCGLFSFNFSFRCGFLSLNFSFKLVACYHAIFPVILSCKIHSLYILYIYITPMLSIGVASTWTNQGRAVRPERHPRASWV
jgi:hypothetical protein